MTTATTGTVHAFERAGLGIAPFRFVRIETRRFSPAPGAPARPGASCQFCSEAISECCIIRDATGKEFHVGNVCVEKTGDRGLIDLAKRELNRLRAEARHKREVERIVATREALQRPEVREALSAMPHPYDWARAKGWTRLEWAEWMMANAGTAMADTCCRTAGCSPAGGRLSALIEEIENGN